jgi:hypothetical protein
MGAASDAVPTITEPLAWTELIRRFGNRWVYLVEVRTAGPGREIVSARVAGHASTQVEPFTEVADAWRAHAESLGYPAGEVYYLQRVLPRVVMSDEIRQLLRAGR